MLLKHIESATRDRLTEIFGTAPERIPLELTADRAFGDVTVNAFHLARELRQAPPKIAAALAEGLNGCGPIASADAVKGFVNLRVDAVALFEETLPRILSDPEAWGRGTDRDGQRLMVEYSAPNTNKPQHLGHMRNNFLGHAMSLILANAGADVLKGNLFNDRGIAICKSMLAYEKFGEGRTPESEGRKGDHFVGDYYIRFEQALQDEISAWIAAHPEHFDEWKQGRETDRKGRPVSEDTLRKTYRGSFREDNFGLVPIGAECQEMLRKWEADDPEVRALWEKMNGWAFAGFNATYERMGVSFDRIYKESETWALGKNQVLQGVEDGVFYRRDDGAIEIDLTAHKLDKKVVLRSDGTSVYITQDIATTTMKAEQNDLDGQIWVVGDEQKYHFQVLFKIMERMGYAWAPNLYHLAYGMVHLPDGRMKSREGQVVDADDLMEEVVKLSAKEIASRDPDGALSPDEVRRRAEVIGLAALRFMLLKVTAQNHMTFDPEESVKFDGDTGARVLYAYARLQSMLREAGEDAQGTDADWSVLTDEAERHVALDLVAFPGYAARAAREYTPSIVANFLIDLVRDLNRFYDRCDVLRESDPKVRRARLLLCQAASLVLRRATSLLGMSVLDRM